MNNPQGVNLQFDATTVPPAAVLEAIPAGKYEAAITGSEMQAGRKEGTGMLVLEHTILNGEHAGRKLFNRLNLQNPSAVAVEIAYKALSAICHATGVMQVQNSTQLHGIPMLIKVAYRPAEPKPDGTGMYEPSNEIKGYEALGASSQAAPTNAAANAGGSPWGGTAPAPAAPAPAAVPAAAQAPAQPWGAPAAPAAPTAPAAPAAAAPAAAAAPVVTMTAKANGATLQQFLDGGWTQQQVIEQGYAVLEAPAAPPAPAAPAAPVPPAAQAMPAAATASATPPGGAAPWQR